MWSRSPECALWPQVIAADGGTYHRDKSEIGEIKAGYMERSASEGGAC